jgi:hypothetical protein
MHFFSFLALGKRSRALSCCLAAAMNLEYGVRELGADDSVARTGRIGFG